MEPRAAAEPRRLRADAARNRQRLIDAAEEVFAAQGIDATLDDIAKHAGVNVATAYRHFANKRPTAACSTCSSTATTPTGSRTRCRA